jgi:hypothetical protein
MLLLLLCCAGCFWCGGCHATAEPVSAAHKDANADIKVDWGRIGIVFLILVCAIITNWTLDFPAAGVWIGILIGGFFRKTPWQELRNAWMGTVFLMALVTCASLMPVEELPPASHWTAFALGFVSAVFDNIPLTKLCLEQGGYDWGVLAYTVGSGIRSGSVHLQEWRYPTCILRLKYRELYQKGAGTLPWPMSSGFCIAVYFGLASACTA